MSVPTLLAEERCKHNLTGPHELYPHERSVADSGPCAGGRSEPATAADVRLWLLDQGAEERKWCEAHDDHLGDGYARCEKGRNASVYSPCSVVSVLVWPQPEIPSSPSHSD